MSSDCVRFSPETRRITINFILESDKKVKNLFIAPKARQILHETAQRAQARCECAQHTGFLIKLFNQESVLHKQIKGQSMAPNKP